MNTKYITILSLIFIIALLIVTQGYYSYSVGERSGYIKEFSKRGYVIKTYEGTLVQQIDGVLNADNFRFSVNDNKVAVDILEAIRNNERVNITYKQKFYFIKSFHGETEYFITAVNKSK
jgi:ABC-type transporter MlaC component